MSKRTRVILAAGVSLMALGGSPRVVAQAKDDTAAVTGLQEIVVTARRREEKLQTVPLSIQAVSAGKIEQQRVQDVTDLQRIVPALNTYASTGRDTQYFTMRGQYAVPGGPGVVSYFNSVPDLGVPNIGISSTSGGGGPGHFYDLENVQVLKGPQGTLFGQNTTGGAILFQPKKPTNQFEGYAQVTLGNLNDKEVEAAVNVPILPDVLLVRLSGQRVERDGFTKDIVSGLDLDNRDFWAGRASVVWRPTDDFENYLVFDDLYSHTNGTSYVMNAVLPFGKLTPEGGVFTIANVWDAQFGAGFVEGLLAKQQALGVRQIVGQLGEGFGALRPTVLAAIGMPVTNSLTKISHFSLTDIATYNVSDDVTFKNIFGWQQVYSLSRGSESPVPGFEYLQQTDWNVNTENFTEELQLQGRALADKLNWQVGAYLTYTHPNGLNQQFQEFIIIPTRQITNNHLRTYALYTQETYDLGGLYAPLDGLKLTAGYRYNWDYRSNYFTDSASGGAFCLAGASPPPICPSAGNANFEAPTWTLSLDYALSPQTLVYITGRRGYIAGGVNTENLFPPRKYAPQYLVDMETGVKSTWDLYGIQARTNLDAFIGYLKGYQFTNFLAGGSIGVVQNIGKATISGIELDSDWLLFPGFDLTVNYAYTFAHYNEVGDVTSSSGGVLDPTFPAVPKHKFSLIGTYTLPFIPDDYGKVTASATWNWTSSFMIAALSDHQLGDWEPHYGTVDVRLDWNDVFGEPFDVGFFLKNVTDRVYRVGAFTVIDQLGFLSSTYSEPQTWGFQLKYRFGGPAEAEAPAAPYAPPPPQAVAPAPRSYLVFFDFNKSDLTPQAVQIVDQAAKNAETTKVTQLTVTGHTDTVGSDAYNMRLSRRRAESVAAQLEKDGIPSSEIEIVAKGKRDLLVPTADGVREPQNRRVQIVYSGGPTS
jgi:iron complex outermembrane receptor protein